VLLCSIKVFVDTLLHKNGRDILIAIVLDKVIKKGTREMRLTLPSGPRAGQSRWTAVSGTVWAKYNVGDSIPATASPKPDGPIFPVHDSSVFSPFALLRVLTAAGVLVLLLFGYRRYAGRA
jgi:hypothetical protein